jgi:hypothetical protein
MSEKHDTTEAETASAKGKTKKVKKSVPMINGTIRGTFEAEEGGPLTRRVFKKGDEEALAEVLDAKTHKRLSKNGVITGFAVPAK